MSLKAAMFVLLGFLFIVGAVAYFLIGGSEAAPVAQVPTLVAGENSQLFGVFEGRVPCEAPCERMKVRLTLHRNPATFEPTEFLLERIYVGKGDDRHVDRGTWHSFPVPNLYGAPAIQLRLAASPDGRQPAGGLANYLQLGDVLLELGAGLEPRVGDASHSFTLSKTR